MSTAVDPAVRIWKNPTYTAWSNMRGRCFGRVPKSRKAYLDKGISFDPSWESFDTFLADMGPRPEGMTLDRKDNSKGYSKDNCRWATRKDQANNTTRNRLLTHAGETLNSTQWAERLGISYQTISTRLWRGWPVEKVLSAPRRGAWTP